MRKVIAPLFFRVSMERQPGSGSYQPCATRLSAEPLHWHLAAWLDRATYHVGIEFCCSILEPTCCVGDHLLAVTQDFLLPHESCRHGVPAS